MTELSRTLSAPNPLPAGTEQRCGIGLREKCCKFLLVGENGFECGRGTSLEQTIRSRPMVSSRLPSEPYPDCQLPVNS